MLDKEVIVIVGAGCIGLCTAYNLSKTLSLQGAEYDIIVVDASDRPFPAASSACTGCFHYYFPGPLSKPLEPLGKYSFDLWAKEAEHIDFRLTTGYRSNSSYGILEGDGKGLDKLPNWVKPDASWNVDTKVLGDSTATVTYSDFKEPQWLMRMAGTAMPC
ncbi:hypothetical protein J7337_011087 [Fusarium musae]|uniref:FAD dependent oxidoreductase domain-containing protein n=1 Tax=Fusarium musae TaxID=1042133 RepID=A0A9P8DAG9_9HYPO|nr:hypothetical protein J7337_011087 [Fusarium musae]KAG9498192.1 hypothetical protein J7337_011087 [Fusarium musae]